MISTRIQSTASESMILSIILSFILFVCAFPAFSLSQNTQTNQTHQNRSFVILQYHHVSEDTPRVTSIAPAELEEHMSYLAENNTVISLQKALDLLKKGEVIPNKAVVITFDDGYKNILKNGHPILKKYGFPYTIFINPSQIGTGSQLSWEDLETMKSEGVTFANHTLDHLHLLDRYANESDEQWLARIKRNIEMAEQLLTEKLGYSLKWLAYPFGEFDTKVKALLKDMGYIGFGQQSGAVGPYSDLQALPRYPAAGRYANLETLKTKINSLAMPVTDVRPQRYVMLIEEQLGTVEIDVKLDDILLARVACYFRGETLPIKETKTGFSINVKAKFYPGRTRINCTAPSLRDPSRFYWYSLPYFTAQDNGTYLD